MSDDELKDENQQSQKIKKEDKNAKNVMNNKLRLKIISCNNCMIYLLAQY
jgi:hypothetical protein